jgi:hypothetical protein
MAHRSLKNNLNWLMAHADSRASSKPPTDESKDGDAVPASKVEEFPAFTTASTAATFATIMYTHGLPLVTRVAQSKATNGGDAVYRCQLHMYSK